MLGAYFWIPVLRRSVVLDAIPDPRDQVLPVPYIRIGTATDAATGRPRYFALKAVKV